MIAEGNETSDFDVADGDSVHSFSSRTCSKNAQDSGDVARVVANSQTLSYGNLAHGAAAVLQDEGRNDRDQEKIPSEDPTLPLIEGTHRTGDALGEMSPGVPSRGTPSTDEGREKITASIGVDESDGGARDRRRLPTWPENVSLPAVDVSRGRGMRDEGDGKDGRWTGSLLDAATAKAVARLFLSKLQVSVEVGCSPCPS